MRCRFAITVCIAPASPGNFNSIIHNLLKMFREENELFVIVAMVMIQVTRPQDLGPSRPSLRIPVLAVNCAAAAARSTACNGSPCNER